jgi:hypothetical protein
MFEPHPIFDAIRRETEQREIEDLDSKCRRDPDLAWLIVGGILLLAAFITAATNITAVTR